MHQRARGKKTRKQENHATRTCKHAHNESAGAVKCGTAAGGVRAGRI